MSVFTTSPLELQSGTRHFSQARFKHTKILLMRQQCGFGAQYEKPLKAFADVPLQGCSGARPGRIKSHGTLLRAVADGTSHGNRLSVSPKIRTLFLPRGPPRPVSSSIRAAGMEQVRLSCKAPEVQPLCISI